MSPRREVPTVYWQAIVAHNLVVLQQGEDVAFVWQYGCRSDRGKDNVLASKCEYPPFRYPPFKCALILKWERRIENVPANIQRPETARPGISTKNTEKTKKRPEFLDSPQIWGSEKKHIKKKTHKQNLHGIVPGFCLCVFLPLSKDPKKTHKQNFGTHPVPGQSRKFVYVCVFSFPDKLPPKIPRKYEKIPPDRTISRLRSRSGRSQTKVFTWAWKIPSGPHRKALYPGELSRSSSNFQVRMKFSSENEVFVRKAWKKKKT